MLAILAFLVVVLLIAVAFLLAKTSDLSSRLQDLGWEIAKLAGRLTQLEEKEPSRERGTLPGVEVPTPAVKQPSVQTAIQPPPPVSAPIPQPHEVIPPRPVSVTPPSAPSRTREEWESLIGGKVLNRIGALALIIGVGFFLKYAFDKNWITEWMRVAIGGLTGAVILLLAARSHRKGLEMFSQGLVGAGIAILYLSVYASFNFYSLVSQPLAFILMSCVTAIAFTQAFKYDSLAVSLLGWLGGFLTPFLLSTGAVNAVGLFTYLALLDIAVLAVLFMKDRWIVLVPLTLTGTYLMYYLWYGAEYHPADAWTAAIFLTIFWFLFHTLDTSWCVAKRVLFRAERRWGGVVNGLAYYVGLYAVLNRDQHDWLAAATLLIGIVYVLSAMVIQRRAGTERVAVVQDTITGILLLAVATLIQFETFTVVMFYALEGAALAWMGRRWNLNYVWYAGSAVLLWGALVLLATPGALRAEDVAQIAGVIPQRVAAYLSLVVGAAVDALDGTNFSDAKR